jgi:hypothetical protein
MGQLFYHLCSHPLISHRTGCVLMSYFAIHFQGRARKTKAAITVEMEASENPTLDSVRSDPTLFCTAFKKNRFYMFTR